MSGEARRGDAMPILEKPIRYSPDPRRCNSLNAPYCGQEVSILDMRRAPGGAIAVTVRADDGHTIRTTLKQLSWPGKVW